MSAVLSVKPRRGWFRSPDWRTDEDAVAGELGQKGLLAAVGQLHGRKVAGEANGTNGEALIIGQTQLERLKPALRRPN